MSVTIAVVKDLAATASHLLAKKPEKVVADVAVKATMAADVVVISKNAAENVVVKAEVNIAAKLALLDKVSTRQAQLDQFKIVAAMAKDGPSLDLVAEKAANYAKFYDANSSEAWATAYKAEKDAALGKWIGQLTTRSAGDPQISQALGILDRMATRQPQLDAIKVIRESARSNHSLEAVALKAKEYAKFYSKNDAASWAEAYNAENNKALAGWIGNMLGGEPGLHAITRSLSALDLYAGRQPQLDQMYKIAAAARGEASLTAVADKATAYANFYRDKGVDSWATAYKEVNDEAIKRIIVQP